MAIPNIILIGLRGSGKSTVGRMLAERLERPFVDLDDLTPGELGCANVRAAWGERGEAAFRAAEVAALRRVLASGGRVISLGGGTPTAPGATAALGEHRVETGARIIYLHAEPGALRSRLQGADNSHRPALTPGATDPVGEIESVYGKRDGMYRQLADITMETEGRPMAQVVEDIALACIG